MYRFSKAQVPSISFLVFDIFLSKPRPILLKKLDCLQLNILARCITTSPANQLPRSLSMRRPRFSSEVVNLDSKKKIDNSTKSIYLKQSSNENKSTTSSDDTVTKKINERTRRPTTYTTTQQKSIKVPVEKMKIQFNNKNNIERNHKLPRNKSKSPIADFTVGNGNKRSKHKDHRNWKSSTKKSSPYKKMVFPSKMKGNDILFGISPCLLALKASQRKVFVAYLRKGMVTAEVKSPKMEAILSELNAKEIGIVELEGSVMDYMTRQRPHQGICLEVSRLYCSPVSWNFGVANGNNFHDKQKMEEGIDKIQSNNQEEMKQVSANSNRTPFWLALDKILDPMNLGALLRSAYFFGVDGIVVSKRNSCRLTPVVSKASSGVMEIQTVYAIEDLEEFLKSLTGWEIIGSSSASTDKSSVNHSHEDNAIDFQKPIILVVGNEGFGLSAEILSSCNRVLSIQAGRQLHPGLDSLNVSVAAGVMLHQLVTMRDMHLKKVV